MRAFLRPKPAVGAFPFVKAGGWLWGHGPRVGLSKTSSIMQECLSQYGKPEWYCPKKLENGHLPQGCRMIFIQLLVYLHFAKLPFAARRLFEPRRGEFTGSGENGAFAKC